MLVSRTARFAPAQPSASPLVETQNTIAGTVWTPSGSNPVITKPNGINEYDIVLNGGTYYLFWSSDTGSPAQTMCDTATSLTGTWTPLNTGAAVFNGRYCTVIYDSSVSLWRAWANLSSTGALHYYTATTPGGTWTDQGVAITPPGSGAYSAGVLDPCVRIMPDASYMMTATDITYSVGEIGFWTSPSGNNGTWTLSRYPIVNFSYGYETKRYDPAPFIDHTGQVVITYGAAPQTANVNAVGMHVYDQSCGGWTSLPVSPLTGPLGNPEIFEFTTGNYTLVWASYPNEPTTTNGGLSFATGSAGAQPWVPHVWDYATLP